MGCPRGCWNSRALRPALVVVWLLLAWVLVGRGAEAATFKCTTNTTSTKCRALIDYVSPNKTELSHIKSLFSLKNLRGLLGANDLDPSTPSNYSVAASHTLKIPFRCTCTSNATGVSDHTPNYTVQPGDILYNIATEVYGGLVTFQEIAAANNIPDPNKIDKGQNLWIPLPCSCDEVGGVRMVHYGHVVESGASLAGIAKEYGTTEATLMSLNNVNASSLQAGQVLDVPLQACNSSVQSDSEDYPLLVSNGTYVYTARGCVTCKCDSANNWTLQCQPSGLQPSSNWSTCPSMQCADAENLYLGNTTTSSGCTSSTCSYAGFYSNSTILTKLVTKSNCSSTSPSPGNNAPRLSATRMFLLICFHLVILFVHFL